MVELSRLCSEEQLEAEVVESAVFGVAARRRRGGVELVVFGRAAQSQSDGVSCVRSSSSELKWGIGLCLEWQLGAEWWS